MQTRPEAGYLLFPFNLPEATARFDLGGQAVEVDVDQLPGVCRDYFSVQSWVDFNNGERGMMVATPDNPLVQLGGFHFGDRQKAFKLERATLLGWVTNNYWSTNWRAHQPGVVRGRYRLLPYAGHFNEARAHRFGREAAVSQPLLQQFGEAQGGKPHLPLAGALLHLPGSDGSPSAVLTLHVKPIPEGSGLIVLLLNASDERQTAVIDSARLQIVAAQQCTLLGEPRHFLPVQEGMVSLSLSPREVAAVHLTLDHEG